MQEGRPGQGTLKDHTTAVWRVVIYSALFLIALLFALVALGLWTLQAGQTESDERRGPFSNASDLSTA